mmetsp:Transcript_1132/g.2430  ORF Transcript_1132/g.2430 Transcript_1132/m.2430 type:complete len:490 (+) Transcript_1132:171-1640(+)
MMKPHQAVDLSWRGSFLVALLIRMPSLSMQLSTCTTNSANTITNKRIGVIGGGASGMFAAVAAADNLRRKNIDNVEVVVLESGRKTLTKVAISGGGRCNVLHDVSKPVVDILGGYPRGSKELRGLMTKRFSPQDAEEWFTSRGVQLKTEPDGRMFPITDDSHTIIDAIENAAYQSGVGVHMLQRVDSVQQLEDGKFYVQVKGEDGPKCFDAIILATGSAKIGMKLAEGLGHTIVKPVPSLFTFNTKHQIQEGGVFHGLAGLSVQSARITFKVSSPGKKKKKAIVQEGPLLITHHGISGPATLRLSAFAARELYDVKYHCSVMVHWAPEVGNVDDIEAALWSMRNSSPKRMVSSSCPLLSEDGSSVIPRRLWSSFVVKSGIEKEKWCEAPKKKVRALARCVGEFEVDVTGKGVFKEEFVTAGGISLKEMDMKRMESKKSSGLFCCGELLNVDGITGGYNFLNCWSTGYVSGNGAADYVTSSSKSEEAVLE